MKIAHKTAVTPKELSSIIERMVNNFSINQEEIAEAIASDPDASVNTLALFCEWVRHWAKQPSYAFDGRNEYSGNILRKIYGTEEFHDLEKGYAGCCSEKCFSEFAENYAPRMHRTLMQTFTGTLLAFLSKLKDAESVALNRAVSGGEARWYRLPLI